MTRDDDRGLWRPWDGSAMEALRIRNWVQRALEAAGGECTGGGLALCGDGEADLDINYQGRRYWIKIRDGGPASRDIPELHVTTTEHKLEAPVELQITTTTHKLGKELRLIPTKQQQELKDEQT